MWCLQCLVDWLATDGTHVVCGQHSCPELSAPLMTVRWAWSTRSLRRLLMWPPHMYEPRGVMDASMIIFAVGLLECRYRGSRIWTLPCLVGAPHHLRIPLPQVCFMGAFGGIRTRVHTRPQGRESNKDSRPVRSTTDSYEGIPAGGFEHHRITEARDWLACHIGVCPL